MATALVCVHAWEHHHNTQHPGNSVQSRVLQVTYTHARVREKALIIVNDSTVCRRRRWEYKSVTREARFDSLLTFSVCVCVCEVSVSYTHLDVYKRQLQFRAPLG